MVDSIPAKTQKTEDSNLHGFEVHRPSSQGTKLLLQVIKAIINQETILRKSNSGIAVVIMTKLQTGT